MRRLRKILLVVLLVPLLLAIAGLIFLDPIARKAVEVGGEQAMGVPTALQDLSLSPFRGEGTLEGLEISNPDGFETPFFMRVEKGAAAMDVGTVLEDTVVVRTIEIDGLEAHLEQGRKGANYEVILGNMKKAEGGGGGGDRKFVVHRIVVRDIDVRADIAIAGEPLSHVDLHFDEIQLENVGSGTGAGAILPQVMGTIVKAVLTAIVEQGARVLPQMMVNGLRSGLQGVGTVGVKVVGKVTARVGGKAIELLGGVGKKATGAVTDAIKGIGGILGGGDDEEEKDK